MPHFKPPIGTAAVTHSVLPFSGVVVNEVFHPELPAYLSEGAVFRNGKMCSSDEPGLGVVLDTSRVNQIAEFAERAPPSPYQGESLHRLVGSHLYL